MPNLASRSLASLLAAAAGLAVLPSPASAQLVEYYHTDLVGNVRAVTDEQKRVIERHDYLPFGEECTTGPCASNPGLGAGQPRKFTGKERDTETGLDYFGARYYGSTIGRFTSVDPLTEAQKATANPQRWNRYAYSLNNPLKYTDPNGKSPTIVTAAIGAGVGFVFGYAGSLTAQAIRTGSFSNLNYDDAAISGLGGAVSGGLAGLTLGASVALQGSALGVIGVSAGTNAVGGAVVRAVDADPNSRPQDAGGIAFDLVAGAAGGAVGLKFKASYRAGEVSELERVAAGMQQAARKGSFGAASGRIGIAKKIGNMRIDAEVLATVVGSKTSDFAAPVAKEAATKVLDQ